MKIKNISSKILIIILFIFTVIRVVLAMKMPMYLQGTTDFDDFLMIKYAKSILNGKWLGIFSSKTLAKGVSFPIFIAINYILGIPYSLGLILLYIAAIILLLTVIKKYIKNKYYLSLMYIFLLYSPVMFHAENVQKIYRGGVIVSASLIVISAMIGIYNNRSDKIKSLLGYSLIASIFLPFFYYLKEDSIWIIPFVGGSIILSVLGIITCKCKKKLLRAFFTILPLISLFVVNHIYCSINYSYYGEFCITDRSGTYFKEMISDIIKIEEENEIKDVWITKDMMYKAIDASKTLETVKPEIDKMYKDSWALKPNGQIEGDIIFWSLKDAFEQAGVYQKGGKYVNSFYKKVDKELKDAYKNGQLIEDKEKIYLSSIAVGFTIDDIRTYYSDYGPKAMDALITYSKNETVLYSATGPMYRIVLMDDLTNSETVWPKKIKHYDKHHKDIVAIDRSIVKVYQDSGHIIAILGVLGFLVLTLRVIIDLVHKKKDYLGLWLILVGFIVTVGVLLFGVLWFCSCFNISIIWHVYNYTCGIISIIQIFELTGIYFLIREIVLLIYNLVKKEYKK